MTDHSVFVASFLDYLRHEKRYSRHTVQAYSRDLQRFHSWAEQNNETPETADAIRSFLALQLQQGRQRSTVARYLAAIKSYYRFLFQRELMPSNPAAAVKPVREYRHLPQFLTVDEMRQLLDQAPRSTFFQKRDLAILEVLYTSGLRLSELAGLRLSDLYRGGVQVAGKGGKERAAPLGETALKALDIYLPAREQHLSGTGTETEALFVNRFGHSLSTRWIQKMVSQRLFEICGRRQLSPHSIRHSFATHMLDNGADILAIKELLGHASLSTTQLYTHMSRQKLREVYRKTHPRS